MSSSNGSVATINDHNGTWQVRVTAANGTFSVVGRYAAKYKACEHAIALNERFVADAA